MIAVKRPDLADERWRVWREEAQGAIEQLISGYQPGDDIAIKEDLYKRAMPFLIELFHGKCAYCEVVITTNQPGDVEHYRPKGRIKSKDGKIVTIRIDNTDVAHPGYWWLAYEWRNLLPSCIDCNRRRRHGEDEAALGKADIFEVRGRRALRPGDDLAQELALLLDPSTETFDPRQHFEFKEDGTMKPMTEEARYSCELLGLNLREQLVGQREMAYLQAKQALAYVLANAMNPPPDLARTCSQINKMWEGRSPYSAFARQGLEAARDRFRQTTGASIDLPLPIPG